MATEEDAWLELKLTPRVELIRSPRTPEQRTLARLRPGGPGLDPSLLLVSINTDRYSMPMMKSMAEKKLRKMGMKRIKKRVIRQCLGNGERKNL